MMNYMQSPFLPHTDLEAGLLVAERIREGIYNYQFSLGKVSVSAGVASYPAHCLQKDELLVKADRALYMSKANGKNRVSAYNKDS